MLLIAGWVQLDASFLWLLCCGKFSFTCAYALDAMLLKMILILRTHTHNTHTWCCPTENSLCRCTYTWRFAIERTLAHVPDAVLLKIHVHLYAYCTLRYWKFTCSQCIDRYWRALKFLRTSILVTFQFDLKQDEQKGTAQCFGTFMCHET